MRYSQSFLKTVKEARSFDSVNATLLQKGGFIDQTMAGVYTFLPLGLRVLGNIEGIIREEMDTVGTEMLMPALSPRTLWATTGRLGTVDVLLEVRGAGQPPGARDAGYILNPTHEEIITEIARRVKPSYKDLPFAVYQIQTKFRQEKRPKSGLLRCREFRMKDLYSFHASEADLRTYYEHVQAVYRRIFTRLGIGADTMMALASGGDFTREYSHEFQTKCETGEDVIYVDRASGTVYNKEVAPEPMSGRYDVFASCEVGNIFPLGTTFSRAFSYTVPDMSGARQEVYMASYGIGSSRIMGVLVEKFHDERGILWPAAVAPFRVHLAGLRMDERTVAQRCEKLYADLHRAGVAVLYDDRPHISPGEKLSDADLIGIPWRLVVSDRTGDRVEVKQRGATSATVLDVPTALRTLTS